MSAKVEGLPGILRRVKRMGMKLAQATASAGSLAALMPGAPESQPPEQTFPLGPRRMTRVSPNAALPRSVFKDWRRDSSLELTVAFLGGPPGCRNGDRNAVLVIGDGRKIGAELVSACCY